MTNTKEQIGKVARVKRKEIYMAWIRTREAAPRTTLKAMAIPPPRIPMTNTARKVVPQKAAIVTEMVTHNRATQGIKVLKMEILSKLDRTMVEPTVRALIIPAALRVMKIPAAMGRMEDLITVIRIAISTMVMVTMEALIMIIPTTLGRTAQDLITEEPRIAPFIMEARQALQRRDPVSRALHSTSLPIQQLQSLQLMSAPCNLHRR